ncbi:MAG: DEAD/DEAH box helicase [Dehalococcoidales bacterium]|nr:DEAD/DEAH box helicase [Dehalococcoidales bacterium]
MASASGRLRERSTPRDFEDFFREATGNPPFPFQRAFAQARSLPQLVQIPTGLGKTAMAVVGWLWRRFGGGEERKAATPRRLVYCLPMRVLVEQTVENARLWITNLAAAGLLDGDPPSVHVLMGGEPAEEWDIHPEREAILVGTQDMLLSRALMRGYGMSRYQWPVHFAFLHNDALWVYDEVQLMGPALSTSAQLEGFRRSEGTRPALPAGSVWLSATLNPDWLDTVDLRPHRDYLLRLELSDDEKHHPVVRARREAVKPLRRAETALSAEHATKRGLQQYAESLGQEVLAQHDPEGDTLVVVNRVERAQALYDALRKRTAPSGVDEILLIHARFRPAERRDIERRLHAAQGAGRVIIATR